MKFAHDVFAEINPALCAAIVAQFTEAHSQAIGVAPAMALPYIALPLALSNDLAGSFDGTTKRTGLVVWLERNRSTLPDLPKLIDATLPVTTGAIRFGCLTGLLKISDEGLVVSMERSLPTALRTGEVGAIFKRAQLLGTWFGLAGSPRAVTEAFGVSV
jgi:hypothetical protein